MYKVIDKNTEDVLFKGDNVSLVNRFLAKYFEENNDTDNIKNLAMNGVSGMINSELADIKVIKF